MKKRKGLIAILIVCAISFAATIGLGIACFVTAFIHLDDGTLQRAWEEIVERYHLEDEAFGVEFPYDASEAGSDAGGQGEYVSVGLPDEDNVIDLSVIPQSSDLKIVTANVASSVSAGQAASAQLSFPDGQPALQQEAWRFELLQSQAQPSHYLLIVRVESQTNTRGASVSITLPPYTVNELDLSCSNASANLTGVSCDMLNVDVKNGGIRAEDLMMSGPLYLFAENGQIELTLPKALNALADCDTKNGAIILHTGGRTDFSVDATAENGFVHDNLSETPAEGSPAFLHLEFGAPSAWVELDTENGNIELSP